MGDILSLFLVKKSIIAEAISGYEKLAVLGVSNQKGIIATRHKTSEDLKKYQFVEEGDFVYNPYRINVGSVGLVPKGVKGLVSPAYIVFSVTKNLIPELFLDFLKSRDGLYEISRLSRGTVRKALRFDDLCKIPMVVPPIEEQKKIIERKGPIDFKLNCFRQENLIQKNLLKKLRQQILQDAIEGKLTAEWRKQNPDVAPATELLKRIAAEKERLIKEKKIKPQKPLPPIKDEEKPFELPDGWVWCRLGDIIYEDPRNGNSPKTVEFVTDIKTLKLGATTKGFFDSAQFKYVEGKIDLDSYLWLEKGDILIQRSNSLDHVGISAIYDCEKYDFVYPDLMMKIKVVKEIPVEFIHKFLTSPYCREYFRKKATGAQKSMPKIKQGTVSETLIPLPPIYEQREILNKLDSIFALCDEFDQNIQKNQKYAEQLMQSVLKEAFSYSENAENIQNIECSQNLNL